MPNLSQSTKPISAKAISRKWHVINVKDQILGRAATEIAALLIGKKKVDYAPNLDNGDYVVVVNSTGVKTTGRKDLQKTYDSFSGYPGGLKQVALGVLKETKPNDVIRNAVSGMLPKNKLRDRRLARLYIYTDEEHPYKQQVS